MNVWCIDANSYIKPLSADVQDIKHDYFIIKNSVRNQALGEHVMPKTKTYSIGLLRIATILKFNGYNVKYVHFRDIEKEIDREGIPDIIAFSAVCPTIPMCHDFTNKYKQLFPDTLFVLGGSHLNVAPELTKSLFPMFDRYSVGYDVDGAEKVVASSLVAPDDEYVDFSLLPYEMSEYAINTCSTIGCSFGCKYCQDRLLPHCEVSKNGFIPYFMERLAERTCIHFFDSVIGGSRKGLLDVCGEIAKCGHSFLLSCDIRAELLDEQTIEALSLAGFKEIRLVIETADESVLEGNDRFLTIDTLLSKIELCKKQSELYVALYSATGLPGTTMRSLSMTKALFTELLQTRLVDEIKSCLFVPYPMDTERYSADEIRIISNDWREYDRQSLPVYDLPTLTSAQIWQEYLDIARSINNAWLAGWGISSVDSLPNVKYGEYNLDSYII